MAEKIIGTDIEREKGYLYFLKGNPLVIYKAKMAHGGKKKKKKKSK